MFFPRRLICIFIFCLFGGYFFSSSVFANYDTLNTKSCSCSAQYYWTAWQPFNDVEERQYQMKKTGSGTMAWKCSKNARNGCSNPNCSSGSSCSIHNVSCACTYGGGVATGTFNRRPRFACLASSVNLANAHVISSSELPASYTLIQNFPFSIVSYDQEASGEPASNTIKCEYACNIGYVRDTIGGVTQCRLAQCLGNAAIDFANTIPVAANELPTLTPYTFRKDYTKSLILNGTNTAEKCEYTCANGYRADLTLTPKKCIPIVCTGDKAINGVMCSQDEQNLTGNLDISRVRVANQNSCTSSQKCEWSCPTDKPFYCSTKNECVAKADDCGCGRDEKMCDCGQCIKGNLTCSDDGNLSTSNVYNHPIFSPTPEQWIAYTYPGYASSYIYLTRLPVAANTVAGKTFYVYNPERIITGMTEAAFLADPSTAIKNATVLSVGNAGALTRLIFNMAQLQSEPITIQTATIDSMTSFLSHRYLCTENVVGATNCSHNGSGMGWVPNFGTVADGDIYVSKSNSGSGITFAQGQKLGIFPVTPEITFQRFDTQADFVAAHTSPIVVSYDAMANGRLPTYEYTFATEGVKMKPNDPAYTEALYLNEWSSLLPGKELAITGKEGMEFNFTTPVNAFGYDFLEQTASLPPWPGPFVDSTFTISIYSDGIKLQEYTFTPANNVASFFGVSSDQTFDRVTIQETVGSVDDELYGKLYIKRNPVNNAVKSYFGGMYSAAYPHPITAAQSCPAGYTGYKVIGQIASASMPNTDASAYVCVYKTTDPVSPSRFWEFGGMYGSGGAQSVGVPRQPNPYTNNFSCPSGFIAQKTMGISGQDYPLYYCWKDSVGLPTSTFGGMMGSHDGANHVGIKYTNPVTNTVDCPIGFDSIHAWGTPYMDHGFSWCYSGGKAFKNCSDILAQNPLAPSGDYLIDPDGDGAMAPLLASCDMTTDGGGWTLIANAAIPASKNGNINWGNKPYFPLLGHYTVGQDNTSSATTFGFIDKNIGQILVDHAKEIRVFAENTTGKKIHIKTDDIVGINKYLKRDAGTHPTTTITKLPGDTGIATGIFSIFDSAAYGENIVWIFTSPGVSSCTGGGSGTQGQTVLSGKLSAACTTHDGSWGVGTVGSSNCGCPTGVSDSIRSNIWVRHSVSPSVVVAPPTSLSCDIQCNNDGICTGAESCDCADCTNGGSDDANSCKTGFRCTKDETNSTCTQGACCPAGMSWSCDLNTCTNSCGTHAPSELKAGIDIPFITCDEKLGSTHFRYQITQGALTYTSNLYPNGTTIRHTGPLTTVGTYSVKCLYGNSTDAAASMTPDVCTKSIVVKDATDTNVQGCSRIYGYKGNTTSDIMSDNRTFEAAFRCESRGDAASQTLPYRITIGTQAPAYLQPQVPSLGAILGTGFVSTQTQKYTFTGSTDVVCAVRVGEGYSTNDTCKIRTCVGTDCATPETFVVTPSANSICTKESSSTYDIGCNENSPQYNDCVTWFAQNPTAGNPNPQQLRINNNTQLTNLECHTSTPPGALGPVKTCTINLPSGGDPVTLFSGDTNSFQTTVYSLKRDEVAPNATIKYYIDYTNNIQLQSGQYGSWQKKPITAVITCRDEPGSSDGGSCACAPTLREIGTNQFWSYGIPGTSPSIGTDPDVMTYTREFINNSTNTTDVYVRDTAGNEAAGIKVNIGIDTVPPVITVNTVTGGVTLTAMDPVQGGSGLWKPIPSAFPTGTTPDTSAPAIFYKTFSRSLYASSPDKSLFEFDDSCNTPVDNADNYFPYTGGVVNLAPQTTKKIASVTGSLSSSPQMVAYCVQDNAGNVTRGIYPSDPVGCFAASNMSAVPTLSTYEDYLISRFTTSGLSDGQKYGYSLSEDPSDAACFRSILSTNITTLVTNQYAPSTSTILDWSKPALLKGTSTPNSLGYYYYANTTTTSRLRKITSAPINAGIKTLIVDGENIQITNNILYTGNNKTLIIVARKNAHGVGGNIYIDPSVTQIDAILIAEGALMNAVDGVIKNSITDAKTLNKRLIINGRLYSYNTRGGSISVAGSSLAVATGTDRKYFNNGSFVPVPHNEAIEQDLERFRMILNDGNDLCSLHVNYQTLSPTNIPPILRRPLNFTGGVCSF